MNSQLTPPLIVVGVDGSEPGGRWAVRQAGLTGARLRPVLAWQLPRTWGMPADYSDVDLLIAFSFADADLTLFLTDTNGQVTCDEDFVFYNQPSAARGAARLLCKQPDGPHTVERAALHLASLPAHIQRVAIAVNMDVDTGLTCDALTHASLCMDCVTGTAWTFQPPADPDVRAMSIAELYRHAVNGQPVWKAPPDAADATDRPRSIP
ncbi:TerD family protein [Streptomyces shenzhenensis]|uniref:TerD family protein n=1 Tax=Streptomyces shenzhenensis TaxID=943815 RepID=UPI002867F3BA|nr:TerD family protein [Streptomyces shenzhenensis]